MKVCIFYCSCFRIRLTFGCMYRGVEIATTILKSWPPPSFAKEKKDRIWQDTFMVCSSSETEKISFYNDLRNNLGK